MPRNPNPQHSPTTAKLCSLGPVEVRRRAEPVADPQRIQRLRAVERHVRRTEAVGWLGNPRTWIADLLSMKAIYLDYEQAPAAVVYVGRRNADLLCLAGSIHHCVGHGPWSSTPSLLCSGVPAIITVLAQHAALDLQPGEEWVTSIPEHAQIQPWCPQPQSRYAQALEQICSLALADEPERLVIFVAKWLFEGRLKGISTDTTEPSVDIITVATPLYVAAAD